MTGFYISRPVLNPELLDAWHTLTGVSHHTPHVTLIYSRNDVDYDLPVFQPEHGTLELPIPFMEPKVFDDDGDSTKKVLVASFSHPILSARHNALKRAGAGWDFPDYIPHITIGATPVKVPLLLLNQPLMLGSEILTRNADKGK